MRITLGDVPAAQVGSPDVVVELDIVGEPDVTIPPSIELVVDNDGLHGAVERSGAVALEKGLHPLRVAMFQQSGGLELGVSWSGPGIKKQPVPARVLRRK